MPLVKVQELTVVVKMGPEITRERERELEFKILKDRRVRSIWTYLTASPCYTTNTNKHDYTTDIYYTERWWGGGGTQIMRLIKMTKVPTPNSWQRRHTPKLFGRAKICLTGSG